MKLCDYGCGKEGNFQLKNGKWCCENTTNKCIGVRRRKSEKTKGTRCKNENPFYNKKHSEETKTIIKQKRMLQKCPRTGKKHSDNTKKIISMKHTNKKLTQETKEKIRIFNKNSIEKIKEKYPLFSKIEEMRYNPDKPIEEKEIQVHCKNHNCTNSKEQGGWFTPSGRQIEQRIQAIEQSGKDNSYIYCSNEYKNSCPLFRFHVNYATNTNIEKNYTPGEYQVFRQEVLKRDNYKCQYCGNPAEHVHHERPQKLEPFFNLDPDYAISVCKKCHHIYSHKDECSTGNLAHQDCFKGEMNI